MFHLRTISYKWLALLTASIGTFLATLDASIVAVSFPSLTRAFAVEPSVVLWVTVAYLQVSFSLMLTVGKLGDVVGRKKIYVTGFALYTAGLVLCSLSQSITQLILSRMVQGAGAAMVISLGTAIVVSAFPASERGRALGIQGGVVSVGLLAGPVLGGFLLDIFDWSAIFYTRVPIGIIGTAMAWTLLKEQADPRAGFRFDWWGALFLFVALSGLLLFFNLGGQRGYQSPLALFLAGFTALFAVLFIFQETRSAEPVVDLALFRNPTFAGGNISLSFLFFALGSFSFLMPFYLIDGLGHSAWETGLIIAVVSLVQLVIAPLSGWLSDKMGSRFLCTAGMALSSLSLLLISRLAPGSATSEVVLRLVLFGIGLGLFQSPNNSSIIGSSPKNSLGTASAMIATLRQVSISLGIAISGTLFAAHRLFFATKLVHSGSDPLMVGKIALVSSFQETLLIAAIICGLGVFSSLIRFRRAGLEP